MLPDRQAQILELARRQGRVQVDDLSQRFEVSVQTIRKDLNDLCEGRLLSRVHGGAVLSFGVENVGYEARRLLAAGEKAAIGRAVADLVPNGASLCINIGTTTEAVAAALVRHTGLMVVTNNINVATTLRPCPEIEVVITGGTLRRSDGGIVGEAAVDFIKQFRVDFAIVGVSAIEPDGTLLDYDYREVRVAQAIIAHARHTILVADATKFERTASVRIGHISEVGTFVTDHCPDDAFRLLCRSAQVRLVEVATPERGPMPDSD